jgi:hypothetical protein
MVYAVIAIKYEDEDVLSRIFVTGLRLRGIKII